MVPKAPLIRKYILTESNFSMLVVNKLQMYFFCLPPKVALLRNSDLSEFTGESHDLLYLHRLDIKE